MREFDEQDKKQKKSVKAPAPAVVQEPVQRELSDVNGPEGGMLPESVSAKIQSKRGSGQRLSDRQLKTYSEKFGRDMSDVHIHTDSESDTISRSLNARAFTIGSDVFLTKGINPDGGGRDAQTMTHELTHVVQQSGHASSGRLRLGAADTSQEHEAEATAQREFSPEKEVPEEDTAQRELASEKKAPEEDTAQRELASEKEAPKEDTVQRSFMDTVSKGLGNIGNRLAEIGTTMGVGLISNFGLGDAFANFMSGDGKIKEAMGKLSDEDLKKYQSLDEDIRSFSDQVKEAENEGDTGYTYIYDDYEDARMMQLDILQKVDPSITEGDLDRYRAGKGMTLASSLLSSIAGSFRAGFVRDPKEKEAIRQKTINDVNSRIVGTSRKDKRRSEEKIKRNVIKGVWEDVRQDEKLRTQFEGWINFRSEMENNFSGLIFDSMNKGKKPEDIRAAIVGTMRSKLEEEKAGPEGSGAASAEASAKQAE